MSKYGEDLTGRTYGYWFVVGRGKPYISPKGDKYPRWACMCKCKGENSIKVVSGFGLRNGISTSCGCHNREAIRERFTKIIPKETQFGRLTVLKQVENVGKTKKYPSGYVAYLCRCNCPHKNEVVVTAKSLKSGNTISCGCYNKECISGENNVHWKGGITSLTKQIRNSLQYHKWRTAVFERDNHTCQFSGIKGNGDIHAHHIKPFAQILEENSIETIEEALECKELWDVSNGVTLLREYHSPNSSNANSFHILYGAHASKEDFEIWFANRSFNKSREQR